MVFYARVAYFLATKEFSKLSYDPVQVYNWLKYLYVREIKLIYDMSAEELWVKTSLWWNGSEALSVNNIDSAVYNCLLWIYIKRQICLPHRLFIISLKVCYLE